jgi:hypothetical protein
MVAQKESDGTTHTRNFHIPRHLGVQFYVAINKYIQQLPRRGKIERSAIFCTKSGSAVTAVII